MRHNATNLQRGAARLFFLHCRPAYRRLRAEPPAASIWPQVRTHNHTVPLSLLAKVPLQFVSEPNLLSALLCGRSEKAGRLFSTGWILVLKENKRGRIQSQTVNTEREEGRKEQGRGCQSFVFKTFRIMPCHLGRERQPSLREKANIQRPASRPAACSVIDWLQPVLPSKHT